MPSFMGLWLPSNTGPERGNSRRCGRVRIHMIQSSLGDVRDLSADGCRIACTGLGGPAAGEVVEPCIRGLDGDIRVRAKVIWRKRTGWLRYEIGLSFLDPAATVRAALAAVARTAPQNEIFARAEARQKSA